MNRRIINLIFFTLLLCLLFAAGCRERNSLETSPKMNEPNEFLIAGSGSNLPITGKLVENYNRLSGRNQTVPKSIGSSGAVKAVSEGAINLGLISRNLTPEELQQGIIQVPYARIGIILGTNYDVPDENLNYTDLVNIFWGKKDKWKNGQMIAVLSRETGDSSNKVLEKFIPGFKNALEDSQKNNRWKVYYTDSEEAEAIVTTSSSIGLTDTGALAAFKLKIKPLQINSIEPTLVNVKNGAYPLYKDLYFVYKNPLSEHSARFLDFVSSEEGQRIISSNGGIPLKGK